MELESIWR